MKDKDERRKMRRDEAARYTNFRNCNMIDRLIEDRRHTHISE